jgi:hypothetical protein
MSWITRHFLRTDGADARQTHDRRQRLVEGDHRLDGEADGATLGHHQFQAVADRRRVPLLEDIQIGLRETPVGHVLSPAVLAPVATVLRRMRLWATHAPWTRE